MMRAWTAVLASAAILAICCAGCEYAGRKPVQARVPATQTPAPAPSSKTAPASSSAYQHQIDQLTLGPLPVWSPGMKPPKSLLPKIPDGKSWLIAKVEEKFAAGEKEYKAGHLEMARRDFDEAVDWILA